MERGARTDGGGGVGRWRGLRRRARLVKEMELLRCGACEAPNVLKNCVFVRIGQDGDMQATERLAPMEGERLTWAQIRQRYPDQHVYLLAERAHPMHPDFLSAIVVGAGATDDEAFAPAERYWRAGQSIEHRFTGRSKKPLLRPPVIINPSKRPLLRPPLYLHNVEES